MKHIFVLNPAAGKVDFIARLTDEIKDYFVLNPDMEFEVYVTKAPGDATRFVREKIAEYPARRRFYACGGDGTLMEVLCGAFGCPDTEIASFPCGSANDYIRSFGSFDKFFSVANQVAGHAVKVDAIECNGLKSLNICAVGMDADAGEKMQLFKKWPLVSGTMAYSLAVIYMFFHKIGRNLKVEIKNQDGSVLRREGTYLFALGACGEYYGGNHHAAPRAKVDDGQLEFLLVEKISRVAVPAFIKKYKAGKHLGLSFVHDFSGTEMTVTSDTSVTYVLDGEVFKSDSVKMKILPASVNFVVPDNVDRLRK